MENKRSITESLEYFRGYSDGYKEGFNEGIKHLVEQYKNAAKPNPIVVKLNGEQLQEVITRANHTAIKTIK